MVVSLPEGNLVGKWRMIIDHHQPLPILLIWMMIIMVYFNITWFTSCTPANSSCFCSKLRRPKIIPSNLQGLRSTKNESVPGKIPDDFLPNIWVSRYRHGFLHGSEPSRGSFQKEIGRWRGTMYAEFRVKLGEVSFQADGNMQHDETTCSYQTRGCVFVYCWLWIWFALHVNGFLANTLCISSCCVILLIIFALITSCPILHSPLWHWYFCKGQAMVETAPDLCR